MNTYVVQTVTEVGDALTITGTVNGIPVTVLTWVSAAGTRVDLLLPFKTSLLH